MMLSKCHITNTESDEESEKERQPVMKIQCISRKETFEEFLI